MHIGQKKSYHNAPFIMHLERVVRLIEMGQHFTVEFNPCSDVGIAKDTLVRDIGLRIDSGGDVAMLTSNGLGVYTQKLTLANYKRVWRCWQNGVPSVAQRCASKWV